MGWKNTRPRKFTSGGLILFVNYLNLEINIFATFHEKSCFLWTWISYSYSCTAPLGSEPQWTRRVCALTLQAALGSAWPPEAEPGSQTCDWVCTVTLQASSNPATVTHALVNKESSLNFSQRCPISLGREKEVRFFHLGVGGYSSINF